MWSRDKYIFVRFKTIYRVQTYILQDHVKMNMHINALAHKRRGGPGFLTPLAEATE